jgi:predicted NBD/HSP70 family sugar kinase
LAEIGLVKGDAPRPADLMHKAIQRIEDGEGHQAVKRALKDAGHLIGHALAGAVLALAPDSITFTGSAACEPLVSGVKAGLADRGAFFMDRDDKDIELTPLRGDGNRFCPARGAALAVFRKHIYRKLDTFGRLNAKAKPDQLPNGERLFSNSMHFVARNHLPLRRRR